MALRREANLVRQYAEWLQDKDEEVVRHRIPISTGGHLYTDVFNKTTSELVEAKASAARAYIRAGLGQLLDYSRFLSHKHRGLLVPSRPADDLVDLLTGHEVAVIWKTAKGFDRSDP